MQNIKRLVVLVMIAGLLLALAGCSNTSPNATSSKKTIKIAYLPITHAVPLFVEKENLSQNVSGLEDVNVELVKFGTWNELIDALNTGKVDGASVLIELAMKAKEQGIDLKVVGLGHRDGNNVTVANSINTPADLKGKTVAVPQRFSTQNILLYKMLQDANVAYADVTVIELPPSEMPAALAEGRIAAYIVAEPFGSKAVTLGKGKVLYESKDLWVDSVCCGLVFRGDFIKNNKEIAQKIVKRYVDAGKQAESKDEHIQEVTAKYLSVDKATLASSLKYTSYVNLSLEKKDYEQLSQYLIAMGLLKNPPAYNDFVENSLINKAE